MSRKNKPCAREKLAGFTETRGVFTGRFVRTGWKNGYREPVKTVLLVDIKDNNGNILCDHLWFTYGKGFEKLGTLREGDTLRFHARATTYLKGYKGYREDVYKPIEWDYRLSYPTKFEKIKETDGGI